MTKHAATTPTPKGVTSTHEVRPADDAERAKTIVASLRAGTPSSVEVYEAFWQLDHLPAEVVGAALAPWTGPLPDVDRLDRATRLAHGLPLPPLRLRRIAFDKDADVLDLGPVAEQQLRIAGRHWDGVDLAPEDRLDGELEGSFAGTLGRHVFADVEDPKGAPLFDVLTFADGAGAVFDAGTTHVVAFLADGIVELRDRRTRLALEEALANSAAAAPPIPTPPRSVPKAAASAPSHQEPVAPKKKATTSTKKTTPPMAKAKTAKKASTPKARATKSAKAPKATPKSPKKAAKTTPKTAAKKAAKKAPKTTPKATAKKAPKTAAKKTAKSPKKTTRAKRR